MSKKEWTPKELRTLRKLCAVYRVQELAKFLPGRTEAAISKQIQRLSLRHRDIVMKACIEHRGRSAEEISQLAQCDKRMASKYMMRINHITNNSNSPQYAAR